MVALQWIAIDAIKPNPRNARTHSKKQIRQIADSISAFGFLVPILIDESGVIVCGHGRHAAAMLLGLKEVPVIRAEGLSQAKRRALAIADNKIGENAGWSREILATELPELRRHSGSRGPRSLHHRLCPGRNRSNRHRLRGGLVRSR
jgi:ParB/RepB/Spo0J family partition protein